MKSPRIESISKEVVFLALKDGAFPTKEGIELSKFGTTLPIFVSTSSTSPSRMDDLWKSGIGAILGFALAQTVNLAKVVWDFLLDARHRLQCR